MSGHLAKGDPPLGGTRARTTAPTLSGRTLDGALDQRVVTSPLHAVSQNSSCVTTVTAALEVFPFILTVEHLDGRDRMR